MTANEIEELAARVVRSCEDKAAKVTDPAEQAFLEDVHQLAQGALSLLGVYPEDRIPTVEQALALGGFLAPAFRDSVHVGLRSAVVARGGSGLPEDYLFVRLQDGYEGGIAPDGRVST